MQVAAKGKNTFCILIIEHKLNKKASNSAIEFHIQIELYKKRFISAFIIISSNTLKIKQNNLFHNKQETNL